MPARPDPDTVRQSGLDVEVLLHNYCVVDLFDTRITEIGTKIADQLLSDTYAELHPAIPEHVLARFSSSVGETLMD